MPATIVMGLQWGDEGKGKIVDLMGEKFAHVVRCQGGNNAGHTIVKGEQEFHFHLIPSGILNPHTCCYIAAGVALNPFAFLEEVNLLKNMGIEVDHRLFISPRAHLILPIYQEVDAQQEGSRGAESIGTTRKGIGPCYEDRVARRGLRVADLFSDAHLDAGLARICENIRQPSVSAANLKEEIDPIRNEIAKYVGDVEEKLHMANSQNAPILLEGAQGFLLDTSFGTYPFVTSSSTSASGMCAGAGLGPRHVERVIGVLKAYQTRVGEGPFPTEEKLPFDHTAYREVGTTTGRKRRIGWLDAFLARQAIIYNSVDALALTKLDVLSHFKEIRLCVGYRLFGKEISHLPASLEEWKNVEPIYERFEGWSKPITHLNSPQDLPDAAKKYLERVEEICGVPIDLLSYGPEREKVCYGL